MGWCEPPECEADDEVSTKKATLRFRPCLELFLIISNNTVHLPMPGYNKRSGRQGA